MPLICPGLKSRHRRDVSFRRAFFQIVIEKRTKDVTSKRQRRIAVEFDGAECATLSNLLPVMPWPKNQEDLVVVRVFRLDGLVHRDVAVDVFLVPQTMHEHHRNLQWLRREDFVDSLVAPVSVVTRMLEYLAPEADLFESATATKLTSRARLHKHVVIVEVTGPPEDVIASCCLLIVDVAHALLPKRAVM